MSCSNNMASLMPTPPHIVVCPSAGIGHLTPFLRLASMLAASPNTCTVTLIIIRPTLSLAETNQITSFFGTHPHVNFSEFHVSPCQPADSTIQDPFLRQYTAVSRSAHHLVKHLCSLSPPPSAVFSDLMLASGINKELADLGIPNYTVITTSARFFSFMVTLTKGDSIEKGDNVEIPGLVPIVGDDIPPPFYNPNHAFTQLIESNCRHLHDAKGVIINSFDFFEPESVSALKSGKVLASLPMIFPVGPLLSFGSTKSRSSTLSWLDNQPSKSTIFISFGSRTAMNQEQIRELANGIQNSGMRFLWVIKTTIVDKEDEEELRNLLGESFLERTKARGLVVKVWVSQEEILAHPAIGGFVSHCGWNSVVEAAQRGVPMLAWPLHGDQRVNAGVVEKAGLGLWERIWGWGGYKLVKGEEIAEKIKEMTTSVKLQSSAERVGKEARKAWETDGSSRIMFNSIIKAYIS